jgi:hypothetical protein
VSLLAVRVIIAGAGGPGVLKSEEVLIEKVQVFYQIADR